MNLIVSIYVPINSLIKWMLSHVSRLQKTIILFQVCHCCGSEFSDWLWYIYTPLAGLRCYAAHFRRGTISTAQVSGSVPSRCCAMGLSETCSRYVDHGEGSCYSSFIKILIYLLEAYIYINMHFIIIIYWEIGTQIK